MPRHMFFKGSPHSHESSTAPPRQANGAASTGAAWDDAEELALLDKACNQKFPIGTVDRWEKASAFMAEGGKKRTPKEIMVRYKAGLP